MNEKNIVNFEVADKIKVITKKQEHQRWQCMKNIDSLLTADMLTRAILFLNGRGTLHVIYDISMTK